MKGLKKLGLLTACVLLLAAVAAGCGTKSRETADGGQSTANSGAVNAGKTGINANKNAASGAQNTGSADSSDKSGDTGSIPAAQPKKQTNIKVVLDWTPNTNHTGLYVARDKGYYKAHGLNVKIIQPGDSGAEQMIATGAADFGVSYQESITQARSQGVPLVSIAAIIQHNTSGFASPVSEHITRPKDFEGKTYGGWGSPEEPAVIKSLMEADGGDFSKVKIINIGETDYFTAVKRHEIDFAWIYYAWTGIDAKLRHQPLNIVYLTKYSKKLDYYTPVLATSEKMISQKPEIVKAFMAATAEGYQYAIDHPTDAANILIKAVPDLNKKLVLASQKWLSPRYQADAPQWGWQKREVWQNYTDWLSSHKLLKKTIDVDKAFTNKFLPKKQ